MYEFYPKEKLFKMFPILETEADMIINFVSCDGVMGYKLSAVIGALNPELKYKFQNSCVEGQVSKGMISITKKGLPSIDQETIIAHIPFKESFKHEASLDYLIEGFKKLEFACESKIKVESIAIQKGIIPHEMLEKSLEGLKLPKIIFYDEYDYYGELERIKNEREAREREELAIQRKKEKEEKERIKAEKAAERQAKKDAKKS